MVYADEDVSGAVFPPPSAPNGWEFGDPAPPGCRWFDVINAVDAFLDEMAATLLPEKVGLVTYSTHAGPDTVMSNNYESIIASLDARSASFPEGGTNIGGGIVKGVNLLHSDEARPWATKVIILLTDGIHNTGRGPNSGAKIARDAGVTIFVVSFSDEANQNTMRTVARTTSGTHIHATTGADLVQAFRDIAHSLPTLLTQ